MPTTNVPKGANRPAAAARTRKHAQRTPLPPKAGDVQAAKETIAEAKAIAPRPRARKANATLLVASTRVSPPMEPKGYAKAVKLRDEIGAHGWETAVTALDAETVEATATRGGETLHITWTNGVFNYETASYVYADRVTKIRNVSQARQQAAKPAEEAEQTLARVAANKAWKRKEAPRPKRAARLPFDPALATDMEVVTALLGRGVEWNNRLRNATETAVFARDAHRVMVEEKSGERIVKFCCPQTGFRAFRLSDLVRVGRPSTVTAGQAKTGKAMPKEKVAA